MRKPNPAIYLHALELLGGSTRREAVFLDDSPGNVAGPVRRACRASTWTDPDEALAELRRPPRHGAP